MIPGSFAFSISIVSINVDAYQRTTYACLTNKPKAQIEIMECGKYRIYYNKSYNESLIPLHWEYEQYYRALGFARPAYLPDWSGQTPINIDPLTIFKMLITNDLSSLLFAIFLCTQTYQTQKYIVRRYRSNAHCSHMQYARVDWRYNFSDFMNEQNCDCRFWWFLQIQIPYELQYNRICKIYFPIRISLEHDQTYIVTYEVHLQ